MTDSLYRELREAILSGALTPGTPISEGALAQRYGVSKTPVREALARLRSEELVRVIPYKGYYVPPISFQDMQGLYQVRLILEAAAAEIAARMVTPAGGEELMALAGVVATDSFGYVKANRDFHLFLAGISRNDRLQALVRDCMDNLQRVLYLDTSTADPLLQVREHIAIAQSIASRDSAGARRLMAAHIEQSQRRGLEQVLSGNRQHGD